jgi:hypothetical protein
MAGTQTAGIAHNANRDGGGMKVYVVPYPPTGERIHVSTGGGVQARWRADGRELFYLTLDGTLMAVPADLEGNAEPPRIIVVENWFEELKRLVPAQ